MNIEYKVRGGTLSIQTQSWFMQIYWPYVQTGAFGLQIFADTSMRIHPAKNAYALMVLGFGVAIIAIEEKV